MYLFNELCVCAAKQKNKRVAETNLEKWRGKEIPPKVLYCTLQENLAMCHCLVQERWHSGAKKTQNILGRVVHNVRESDTTDNNTVILYSARMAKKHKLYGAVERERGREGRLSSRVVLVKQRQRTERNIDKELVHETRTITPPRTQYIIHQRNPIVKKTHS
jgi:hypothetical protein